MPRQFLNDNRRRMRTTTCDVGEESGAEQRLHKEFGILGKVKWADERGNGKPAT